MARPVKQLDEALIERLAAIHCTNTEIAAALDVSVDTLDRRYADLIRKGREKGKTSLRRSQWEAVKKGNVTMMIWLGKQLLDQRDNKDLTVAGPGGGPLNVNNSANDEFVQRLATSLQDYVNEGSKK